MTLSWVYQFSFKAHTWQVQINENWEQPTHQLQGQNVQLLSYIPLICPFKCYCSTLISQWRVPGSQTSRLSKPDRCVYISTISNLLTQTLTQIECKGKQQQVKWIWATAHHLCTAFVMPVDNCIFKQPCIIYTEDTGQKLQRKTNVQRHTMMLICWKSILTTRPLCRRHAYFGSKVLECFFYL